MDNKTNEKLKEFHPKIWSFINRNTRYWYGIPKDDVFQELQMVVWNCLKNNKCDKASNSYIHSSMLGALKNMCRTISKQIDTVELDEDKTKPYHYDNDSQVVDKEQIKSIETFCLTLSNGKATLEILYGKSIRNVCLKYKLNRTTFTKQHNKNLEKIKETFICSK